MAIEHLTAGTSQLAGLTASTTSKTDSAGKSKEKEEEKKTAEYVPDNDTAAVYEKSGKSDSVYNEKKVQQMLSESNLKTEKFKKLIETLLNKQSEKFHLAYSSDNLTEKALDGKLKDFFTDLEVDDATRAQAQQDISENGYYGVKQTSERILDFAKAIAGDDLEKIDKMYDAVMEGFEVAQRMWGGDLPDICSETLETIQKGFDDWKNEVSAKNSAEQEAAATLTE